MSKPEKKRMDNSHQKARKKGRKEASDNGFSSLNPVTGVSKPHKAHRSSIPVPQPKTVAEPFPVCPICGSRIEVISNALLSPEGQYVHFDCVLDGFMKSEHLAENESISYIGSGNFAVVAKDGNGSYSIVKTLPYESSESNRAFKEYVEGLKV